MKRYGNSGLDLSPRLERKLYQDGEQTQTVSECRYCPNCKELDAKKATSIFDRYNKVCSAITRVYHTDKGEEISRNPKIVEALNWGGFLPDCPLEDTEVLPFGLLEADEHNEDEDEAVPAWH